MPVLAVTQKSQNRYALPPQGPCLPNLASWQANGLVGWWQLNDGPVTCRDSCPLPTKHHMTVNGTYARGAAAGQYGGGWGYANGATPANVLTNTSAVLTTLPTTFVCRLIPTGLAATSNLVVIDNGAGSNYMALVYDGGNGYSGGGGQAVLDPSSNDFALTTTTALSAGSVYLIIGVAVSATNRAIYMFGPGSQAGGKGTNTTSISPSGWAATQIGGLKVGASVFSPLSGTIFDARIYNTAWTEGQVYEFADPKWTNDLYYRPGRVVYSVGTSVPAVGVVQRRTSTALGTRVGSRQIQGN